jgi:hypothetical protein
MNVAQVISQYFIIRMQVEYLIKYLKLLIKITKIKNEFGYYQL